MAGRFLWPAVLALFILTIAIIQFIPAGDDQGVASSTTSPDKQQD